MSGKTFPQTLNDARLLVSGIRKNVSLLEKRSITAERADEIEALVREVETLDSEQESLKARLKTLSVEVREKTAELKSAMSIDTRIIKADIPQSLWKEFGIQAKK